MVLPAYSELSPPAVKRLSEARYKAKICFLYAGVTVGVSLIVFVIGTLVDGQIAKTGGLANMGIRTVLSTVNTVLPILQSVFAMLLEFGFLAAMLRIVRGRVCTPMTLKTGLDRFGPVLRLQILKSLITMGVCTASFYAGIILFSISPLSRNLSSILLYLIDSQDLSAMQTLLSDPTVTAAFRDALLPMGIMIAIVFLLFGLPILFRLRFASFVLLDHPQFGAMYAMRQSRLLLRGNVLRLLRLDLRMWWYYLALAAGVLLCYSDMVLITLGVALPVSADAAYYLSYAVYLPVQFAILYFLKCRVNAVYAMAYDSICPKEEASASAVVLGSIFGN